MSTSKVSIIVLVWNGLRYLPGCLQAVSGQDYPLFETIVVDNGSTDGSADFVARQFPQITLIRNERNVGFAAGNNAGIRAATGDILVFLNQDTIVQPGWLTSLIAPLQDPQVGITGCKIVDFSGKTILHCGGYLDMPLLLGRHIGTGEEDKGQYDAAAEVEYVTGASLAIRRDTLERIGAWDEQFTPAYYEDVDLCWRARAAGLIVRYEPTAVVRHDESSSTRSTPALALYYHCRARLFFLLKHYPVDWILQEFVPAERTRLEGINFVEIRADHRALLEARALCGRIFTAEPRTRLSDALDMLRQVTVRRQNGDEVTATPAPVDWGASELIMPLPSILQQVGLGKVLQPLPNAPTAPLGNAVSQDGNQPPQAAPSTAPTAQDEAIQALVHELLAHSTLQEYQFKSTVPVLGPAISAIRRMWNSVSTKWYVRTLMDQQSRYNATVVKTLHSLQQSVVALGLSEAHMSAIRQWSSQVTQQSGLLTEQLNRVTDELNQQNYRIYHLIRQITQTHYGLSYMWDIDSVVAQLTEQQAALQKQVDDMRAHGHIAPQGAEPNGLSQEQRA